MGDELRAVDELVHLAQGVDVSTPTQELREMRARLVRTSVFVSYGIGVTALDLKFIDRCWASDSNEVIQALVDELPEILSNGWVGGGWSISPDASASVAAAEELSHDHLAKYLDLHEELVTSDIGNLDVVTDLRRRLTQRRLDLFERRDEMQVQIRRIQGLVQEHYASGQASVDDWLR